MLINHKHHNVDGPYGSNYAIYVRQNVKSIKLAPRQLPPVFLRASPIAVRAFDADGLLKSAEIAMGPETGPVFERLLSDERISYLHAHYAAYGCFAARINRA